MSKRRWARSSEPELLTPAQFLALGAQPDGTIVRVQLDAAKGKNARFRFNAASASPYKWEAEPGSQALISSVTTGQTGQTSTTPWQTATACFVVPPLAGDWEFDWTFQEIMGVSQSAGSSIAGKPQGGGIPALTGPAGVPADSAVWTAGFGTGTGFGAFYPLSHMADFTINAAGLTIPLQYTSINYLPSIYNQKLRARPIRVLGP